MNELKFIPLQDIIMLTNYRDVEPVNEKDPEIIELSKSIEKHGVMQPILVRPNGKAGKYELIFGHRRLVAGKIARLDTIPSNIKPVKDEEILEYQVTENLQRKDVHPMDEAIAFKSLIDKRKYSVDEIALRFAKSKEFVTQRLKLNDLIPDLQKDFKKGAMLLGHAIAFCRLTPEDQKKAKENIKWSNNYRTVADLNNFIDRNIIQNLSAAAFKKDDAELVPAAGACKVCPKRSGFNRSLFADLDKEDRCFDSACFALKTAAFIAIKAKDILENEPSVFLVCENSKDIPAPIKNMAKELDVKILSDDTDFSDWTYTGSKYTKKATGFYVQGYKAGQRKTIYLPGSGSKGAGSSTATKEKEKSGNLSSADIDEEIKRINDREKRSKELDLNKVHKDTLEQLDKVKKTVLPMPHQTIDRGIMIFILLQECHGFAVHDKFKLPGGSIGYSKKGYSEDYFKQLSKISDDDLAKVVREIAWSKWMNKNFASDVNTSDTGLRLIAQYAGIDIMVIEKAQQEIADKRNERIAKRISDLREKKKELTEKKIVKKPKAKK
jgi:ParB/RepB/Spo0J family partition protein